MANVSFRAAGLFALLAAALYQTWLRDIIVRFGVGRTTQPISDFPFRCRRISYPEMQACEDMWLDEDSRQLYLACSNVIARRAWSPNGGRLNESALHMKDSVVVLDVDRPVGESFSYRVLATSAFYGTAGEGSLHTLSVSGRKIPGSSKTELYLINNKPSLSGPTGGVLADNSRTGANTTVELFEHQLGSSTMQHVRTFSHPLITTPNNIAPIPDGSGFYISNDHGIHKTGIQNTLSMYLGTGNVVYCTNPSRTSSSPPTCRIVATGFSFPNGLTIPVHDPKTLYVPSTALGKGISIFKIHPDGSLTKLQRLSVPYPIDNLSPSVDGHIYAAAFPNVLGTLQHFDEPESYDPTIAAPDRKSAPATVLRISKVKNLVNDGREVTWSWDKVIEDAAGEALPTTTTAVRDSKTGRLFMTGLLSYFITVCEPR